MKKINLHAIINSILLLILIVFGLYSYISNNKQDIVYIDNMKLFNSFNMTKDIMAIEEAKIKTKRKELDSLYVIYQTIKDKEESTFKNLQQQIANKSKAFQELQDNYTHNLSKTIWNRLNGYIEEYGKINNLKIILGTTGNGNVMYTKQNIDITNKILQFSNQKYEGNN